MIFGNKRLILALISFSKKCGCIPNLPAITEYISSTGIREQSVSINILSKGVSCNDASLNSSPYER